ncbi:hypothetical protein [Larkinella soli]|uniref:hypothetical protein n=1 Tax=Larkinella soli TaxID=1770527 RepID=UPI000FFBE1A1|nr:hypothetical protein [Larkinella soli]
MKNSTKELIYTLLDILDVLKRSNYILSGNSNAINEAKSELFALINDGNKLSYNVIHELIGTIPAILIDKNKFPSNGDIVKFAEMTLNIKVPYWEKKKREEIIGRIVYVIAEEKPKELSKFIIPWEEFNSIKLSESKKDKVVKNFVDTWLEFFENYNKQ